MLHLPDNTKNRKIVLSIKEKYKVIERVRYDRGNLSGSLSIPTENGSINLASKFGVHSIKAKTKDGKESKTFIFAPAKAKKPGRR